MELVQQLAPSLLLFHVLCPLIAGILLASGLSSSSRTAQRGAVAVNLLLAVSSLLLLWLLFKVPQTELASREIRVGWQLLGGNLSPGMMDRVVWGIVPSSAVFLAVLPWLSMSVQIFTPDSEVTVTRTGKNMLLLGTLGLFTVGWDVGSLLCGAFFTVLLIAILIARHGVEEKRSSAGMFLTVQSIGILLLAAGLAMFMASAGAIRSAPHGLPGNGSTSLPDLAEIIQSTIHQHPAAEQLWGEYQVLPAILVLCGIVMMGAGFPLQVWMSEVAASSALGERLWLVAWVKGVFLVGLRLLHALDPTALQSFGWWGLGLSIPGALFVSSLLFSQAYLPRLQSSGLVWTQQVVLISAFTATQDLEVWLVPLVVGQLAAMVLFTIALTTISERYRSVEISSFQGLSGRAGWLAPLLVTCTLTLTLSPLGQGLSQLWLVTVTLLGSESWWGSVLRLMFLLADLLALGGLARVTRQLCTGPLRLPEMDPGLRERIRQEAPTATLSFSASQKSLLFCWGILAIATSLLFPLLRISV